MTQFVSHIPVDIAVSRSPRHHYPGYRDHYPPPPHLLQHNHKKTDGNASFLRAARSGNVEKIVEYLKGNIDINTSNANGLNALHLAAKEGHVNVVTELLKRGANVNAATKKGNTALHIASLAGQEEIVKVLIQLGANVNVQSQNGFTPLYMAAQENHDSVVSFLLANGANQSLATEDGFTPLAVALQQGHDKVVAVLLENDTKGRVRLPALHIAAKKDDCKAATLLLQSDHNPDVTSKSGFTPLHIAAHYGNENIAKILLSKGADVNYAAKHQITPLHVASKWGKINMVMLLLEKGANIEAATRDGLTPLHCAARSGHDQVVDLLLEKGAPFLAKTKNGLAPLHMASQGDHVDSARILLYHKAPVDDVTVDYLTALHVAAHCGHVKVAKLLLDRKADPNARALNGFTPLHIACKKNRIKVVELLLKHGASIEATTESGLTPLHVASFMGCMNIVIYLIQNGSNPDVPTVRGETPLHLAARANQTDIIRILLRNGASVDARAREEQTPLHIASRLGNVDIVSLLLQHGAAVDATTKDMYTALHIASKEDQEEVASSLLDHGASLTATTKKGFTPLHLAAKYGNIKVARLLLQKGAAVDAQGKNGVTPLHVASHYDHVNVALLLLEKGASPHAMAKNGYTPLHIAAKKNQMDIASTLLEYGANANAESKAGFTPLHLASQEGHADISSLLIDHKAKVNHKANNGLTPLHLCAQDDKVNVATILVDRGAEIGPQTKAGYTPLHVASHFGQINMVRFLIQNKADIHTTTSHGYTALHQAAQQGHTLVVNHLLENQASPNVTTTQGQTPLSIAQRLGYISVVETLKVVTETTVTTTTTTVTEEKYKVVAPETMQETFMTDSEDEGGADFDEAAIFGKPTHATHVYLPFKEGSYFQMSEEAMLGDQSYRYLTADEMKSLGDDSLPIDVTKDEKHHDVMHSVKQFGAPMVEEDKLSPQHGTPVEGGFSEKFSPDNIDLGRVPVHAGRFSWADDFYSLFPKGMSRSSRLKWKTFLVSFMVDARGGAMRGCRHSGVRVIIPPRKASMPMRITCRYLRKEKLIHPPPLMEGEACASRILEMGPVGARFLGPVIIEVPHFASTRGKEREITILRSDTGESWREHTLEASEEAVQEVLNESFEGEELSALEDLNTNRITRILTTDFPQYFAIVTRVRQEVHGVGPEGGMVSSTVVPQVQAIFPEGALTKKIRVGLQAQPIAPELVAKLLGNRVAVSPIVTVEPRRRKFHKPITLTIPVPQAATKGMINQYSGDAPTLRLLCSITGSTKSGGSSKAQWEDVTGSTPLTFVNDCVSFTTTVSARFWLMDCRQVNEVTRYATELYQEAVYVPFMSKFVIFAKRYEPYEAQLRVFCMTDDKEDKTLECQEHFTEVAKSRDVEVLEGKLQYLEFAGNLAPVTKSGEQLKLDFQAFHENRLPFTIRVKDPHMEPMGRIAFMREPKTARGDPPQTPICNLNVVLPEVASSESSSHAVELVTLEKKYDFMQESGLSKPEVIHRADLRLSDIARELDKDWVPLAQQLELSDSDVSQIKAVEECENSEKALMMLRLWLQKSGSRATGNELEKGLRKINREDIIKNCMFNVELVTDDVEKAVAKVHLDQSGFDVFKEELGSSREASMRRGASLDASVDEQDITKEAESAAETSSETGSLFERDQISQAFTDELMKDNELGKKLKEVAFPTLPVQSEVKEELSEIVGAQDLPIKLTESETWPSLEMDTSQVSISSLPDDEKSEPTTATIPLDVERSAESQTQEDKTDAGVTVLSTHLIQKTTHMTLSSNEPEDISLEASDLKQDVTVPKLQTDEQIDFAQSKEPFVSSSSPILADSKVIEQSQTVVETVSSSYKNGDVKVTTASITIKSAHAPEADISDKITKSDISESVGKIVSEHGEKLQMESVLKSEQMLTESELKPELDLKSKPEASDSSFVPCAFVNTAFAGAELIDEVEQVASMRSRSPYEVVRDGQIVTSSTTSHTEEQTSDIPASIVRSTFVTRSTEIIRRPLLQHIPSEISEEDLVEREISSPITKEYFEEFSRSTGGQKSEPLQSAESSTADYKLSHSATEQITSHSSEAAFMDSSKTSKSQSIVRTSTVTQVSSTISSEGKIEGTLESDTGIPSSPFELISESEISDKETRSGTLPLSLTMPKSDEADKSPDSVIMSASFTDKTFSADGVAQKDSSESCTLNEGKKDYQIKSVEYVLNGPGEVEYTAEYDDGDEYGVTKSSSKFYAFEESITDGKTFHESVESEEVKKSHYSSVSDDVADAEIGEILKSDHQMEDIIERPVTPEPPVDDFSGSGFIRSFDAKEPISEFLEQEVDEEADYSLSADGEQAVSSPPLSPDDSKSGFAYGMQFEKDILDLPDEAMDVDSDQLSEEKESMFSYGMRFEQDHDLEEDIPCYGDLYTHEEVDEDALENGEKSKIIPKYKKDPEFDILAGKKYFSKNVDLDEMSTSSLQEFERLEAEIVSGRKSSIGSIDSLNGKLTVSKSGDHDDVSMSSLTEFERLEKECIETDKIPPEMQESITQLSEIEEGHESQASETSQENKSDAAREEDMSIADEYDAHFDNIEEIILKSEKVVKDELPYQILIKQAQKPVDASLDQGMLPHKVTETTKLSNIETKITTVHTNKISLKSTDRDSREDKSEDIEQDSLREEFSLKPDSLTEDRQEYLDSLHEGKCDDVDSLQGDEMRDSLFEDRHLEDDSLHEMDILPDESSLSLESSFAAAMSHDSSKADEMRSKLPEVGETTVIKHLTTNLKGERTEIVVTEIPNRDVMLSSTDSLEQSSSAAAAFHLESESAMSTSLTSALMSEDNTMVSSTDTLEQEGRITFRYEDIPVDELEILVKDGRKVIVDSEGNIQTEYNVEHFLASEDNMNDFNIGSKDKIGANLPSASTTQVYTTRTTSYASQPKEIQQYRIYKSMPDESEPEEDRYESSQAEPDIEIEEIHTTDEFGNPRTIKKMKKVIHTKTQFSSSSSSNNVEEKLKEFLREHAAGETAGLGEEEVQEERSFDEKGNVVLVRTVQQKILTEPEVHSRTFTGPEADTLSQEFVDRFKSFDPSDDTTEFEKVDEQGNVIRVTKQVIIKPEVHSVSFSGPNAHQQMEEYMKQWNSRNGDGASSHFSSHIKVSRTAEECQELIPSGDTEVKETISAEAAKTLESTTPHTSEQTVTHTTTIISSHSESGEQTSSGSGDKGASSAVE
nr:ankyrin-2 isoform X20 [Parasteatoda tepidariorum]